MGVLIIVVLLIISIVLLVRLAKEKKALNEELEMVKKENILYSEEFRKIDEIRKEASENLRKSELEVKRRMEVISKNEFQSEEKCKKNEYDSDEKCKRNEEKVKLYENSIKAIRNKIKGYGEEYFKPTFSLIDKLAEEYGYTEAGQELRNERENIRQLIKKGLAADCDYVEISRKNTAINFVLDAFNGKVESILTRIKIDNFGKLEQEIKDAYSLVNLNGDAFRSAKITKEYLNSRLRELELSVQVFLLREKEKEEQKQLKEQMREEEKARREYEKAIRDAELEEARNQKALEKAMKEYENIMATKSEEEKQKYAEKIAELEKKLEEAHQLKERTVSQAQLTRSGHVYIISNIGSFGENVYKIGMTRRLEPLDRVKELGDASVPFPFDVHAMIYSEDAPGLESKLHKEFINNSVNLVNMRKEFFNVELDKVESFVKENHGEFKLTILAEATQYRETIEMRKQHIIPEYSMENEDFELEDNRLSS